MRVAERGSRDTLPRMAHTVVSLLAERPEAELRKMLGRTQTELARLRGEVARAQVEVDQVEQALARQSRQTGPSRGGETREQVLDAFRSAPDIARPAGIIDTLHAAGVTVKAGAIRNMIRRLVDEGMVEQLGGGQYRLASRNDAQPDARTGPHENEAVGSLLTTTGPQEAS